MPQNASVFVANQAGDTFTHIIDGVERAYIPASGLIRYIANLAPEIFAATAAAPQIDAVSAIVRGLLNMTDQVFGSVQDGSHPSVATAPPPPPVTPAGPDLNAGMAALTAAAPPVAPPPAAPAATPQDQNATIAALEAQLAALKGTQPSGQ